MSRYCSEEDSGAAAFERDCSIRARGVSGSRAELELIGRQGPASPVSPPRRRPSPAPR
jgi:hypothetical protein